MYNWSLESVLSGNIEKDYFTLFTGIYKCISSKKTK